MLVVFAHVCTSSIGVLDVYNNPFWVMVISPICIVSQMSILFESPGIFLTICESFLFYEGFGYL